MSKQQRDNLIAGLALTAILLIFGGMVFKISPLIMFHVTLALVAIVIGAVLTWNAVTKTGAARTTARRLVTAAVWVLVLGGVVYAASALTPSGTFNHADYFEITATSDNTSNSSVVYNGDTITVTAKGYKNSSCKDTADTVNVTIKNKTTATIQFNFDADDNITDLNGIAEGTAQQMGPGSTFTFKVASAKGESSTVAGTITISNLTRVSTGANVTTSFLKVSGGSYKVDGNEILEDTSITDTSAHTFTLEATPDEGFTFYGWVSSAFGVFNENEYEPMEGTEDIIYPLFVKEGSAIYQVGNEYHSFLDLAISAAQSGNGLITVCASGTTYHSDGVTKNFIVPNGVKILVPMNATDTGLFEAWTPNHGAYKYVVDANFVKNSLTDTYAVKPVAYVTLTVPQGTTITCQSGSAISLSSTIAIAGNNGYGTGISVRYKTDSVDNGCGFIDLDGKIVLEGGSNLYCYGFIIGDGTVEAMGSATVYEPMEIQDYKGGDATSGYTDTAVYNTFPFNQYYVQNIEANYLIHHNAISNVVLGVNSGKGEKGECFQFIGPSGLFRLKGTNATILRSYNGTTDRITYTVNGDLDIDALSVTIDGVPLNSGSYVMPLNQNLTIIVNSGTTTVKEDIVLCPETQLIVNESATLTVSDSANMYLFDVNDWNGYAYMGKNFIAKKFSPTRTKSRSMTKSAYLEIKGTMNMYGNVFTTCGRFGDLKIGSDAPNERTAYADPGSLDKVIHGSGTINNKGEWKTGAISFMWMGRAAKGARRLWVAYADPAVANIVGVNTGDLYYSFSAGTADKPAVYHGIDIGGVSYWYQNVITVEGGEITPVDEAAAMVIANGTDCVVTRTINSNSSKINSQSVAVTDLSGTFSFTVEEGKTATATGADLTQDEATGVYTISNATADVVITVGDGHVHEEQIVPGTPATCTEPGLTDGVICADPECGEIITEQEVIDALGHTDKKVDGTPATCTENGLTDGVICAVCEETITAQEVITASGHKWVDATFDAPKTCDHCGETEGEAKVAEAMVGEQKYETLAEAVENAADDATIVVLKDISLADDAVVDAGTKTIDFNGFNVRGNVFGTLMLNGGTLITVQDYEMAGPNGTYYKTEDAIFTMDTSMNIVVLAGTIELAQDWWTLAGQSLTIGEDATFVIPDGLTLQVLSTVVVDGTVSGAGKVNLYSSDATITTVNDQMTNITTTAGETVWYTDGKYVVHNHSFDDEAVTTEATCTVAGEKTFTCECGEFETEEIPALNHVGTATTTVTAQIEGTETHETVVTCECGHQLSTSGAVPCEDTDKNGECEICHGTVIVGTTVNGQIMAYSSVNAPVVKLYIDGEEKYSVEAEGATKSGTQYVWSFQFSKVEAGTYDLVVTKAGHVSYTITGVQVDEDPVDLTKCSDASISMITMLCGDIDGDDFIAFSDLNIILAGQNYGKYTTVSGTNPIADLNGDGAILFEDLTILLAGQHYGKNKVTVPYA